MPKSFTFSELIRYLEKKGFVEERQLKKGKLYRNPRTGCTALVHPLAKNSVPTGTLHAILKQASLLEEFRKDFP
jgi:predicted RNA binding protein YcfA (HicA-like mRNA interferase family)